MCYFIFFRFLFWRYFEKIVTGKTTVVNPSVIEEHPEFSNFECGLQRVGFKSSESYPISLLAGTKGRVILATRYSVLQFLYLQLTSTDRVFTSVPSQGQNMIFIKKLDSFKGMNHPKESAPLQVKFRISVDDSEWLVFERNTFECCWSLRFFWLLFSVCDFYISGSPERIISLLQSISCRCNI